MERGEGQERPAVIASYLQTRSNEGLPDDSDYVLVVRMEHTAHSKTCDSTKYMDVVVAPSGLSKAVFAGWPFLKSPCRPPLSRTRVFAATLVEKNHPILLKCLGIAVISCARNASASGRSFDGFGTHVEETRMWCLIEDSSLAFGELCLLRCWGKAIWRR